jgi:Flp pilus assembly protein TadD
MALKRYIGLASLAIAYISLAASFAFADSTAPAALAATKMAAKAPSAADYYALGYKAAQAGRYDEAIGNFRSAISLKANYAEAYNMLGFSLRKTGNLEEAYKNYDTALRLKPDFPEAREYYGEAYLMDGKLKDALRQYLILQKAGKPQAKELLEKIDEFLKANPGA